MLVLYIFILSELYSALGATISIYGEGLQRC
jgi:hypothetical protein